MKFLKPFISKPSILNPKPTNPLGWVSNDGVWAAVPLGGKQFVVLHNGRQSKTFNTYKQALDFIKKQSKLDKKKKSISSLEDFL